MSVGSNIWANIRLDLFIGPDHVLGFKDI
ncbi:BnaC03g29570D [Brassica napus]|uniref:BnaC03g29570D protein n=1 Tax=Brassica napus TaxID=3708 RepID=A0A078G957_BRANA|nr:BnaC03g29570D [Brassica napus]